MHFSSFAMQSKGKDSLNHKERLCQNQLETFETDYETSKIRFEFPVHFVDKTSVPPASGSNILRGFTYAQWNLNKIEKNRE